MVAVDEPVTKAEPVKNFGEVGVSGLRVSGGRIREELLTALQGDKAVKVYKEMRDNDAIVNALCWGVEQEVRKSDWTIDQGDAQEADAELLEQCRDDMEHPFSDVVSEGSTMVQFGWAWMETVFKQRSGLDAKVASDYDDGKVGWKKISLRSQDSLWNWDLAPNGDILGMNQRTFTDLGSAGAAVLIPANVSLLFRTSHLKNNPEGRSMLRSGYRAWWYKKRIEELEAIGVERDFAGLPIIGVPAELLSPDATAPQMAALEEWKSIGRNLRMDEQACVVKPNIYDEHGNAMYTVEFGGTQSRRLFDTSAIINRWAVAILQGALADVLMLGHEKVGTNALGDTKSEMFTNAIQALVDELREVMNRSAVPRLMRLNGIKPPFPKFLTSPVGEVDPAAFIEMVLNYAKAGAPLFPDNDLDSAVREKIGLPERSQEAIDADNELADAKLEAIRNPPPTVAMPGTDGDAPIADNTLPTNDPAATAGAKPPAKKAPAKKLPAKKTAPPTKAVAKKTIKAPAKKTATTSPAKKSPRKTTMRS